MRKTGDKTFEEVMQFISLRLLAEMPLPVNSRLEPDQFHLP